MALTTAQDYCCRVGREKKVNGGVAMSKRMLAILTAGFFLVMTGAWPVAAAEKTGGLSEQDSEFVKEAATGSLMEVQLGKIAAERASSSEVKQFAQTMVEDHSKASAKLKEIATSKGIQLPTQLDQDHQEKVQELSQLSGSEFDREYMSHMVDDHQEDIDTFKEQADDGKDPGLKQFASQTVPKLEHHLQMAKQISEKVSS